LITNEISLEINRLSRKNTIFSLKCIRIKLFRFSLSPENMPYFFVEFGKNQPVRNFSLFPIFETHRIVYDNKRYITKSARNQALKMNGSQVNFKEL